MTDPATASAQTVAVSITAFTVALLGVPHTALLCGFLGAGAWLMFTAPETRGSALLSVFIGGLIGAVSGTAAAEHFAFSVGLLNFSSMLVGAGAKPLLTAAIKRLAEVIAHFGEAKS